MGSFKKKSSKSNDNITSWLEYQRRDGKEQVSWLACLGQLLLFFSLKYFATYRMDMTWSTLLINDRVGPCMARGRAIKETHLHHLLRSLLVGTDGGRKSSRGKKSSRCKETRCRKKLHGDQILKKSIFSENGGGGGDFVLFFLLFVLPWWKEIVRGRSRRLFFVFLFLLIFCPPFW